MKFDTYRRLRRQQPLTAYALLHTTQDLPLGRSSRRLWPGGECRRGCPRITDMPELEVGDAERRGATIEHPAQQVAQPTEADELVASDNDRWLFRAVEPALCRQLRWNKMSMAAGLLLGTAALAMVFRAPWDRWPLALAAALELAVVPWYTAVACRRLKRMLSLVRLDLEEGLAQDDARRLRKIVYPFAVRSRVVGLSSGGVR